MKKEFNSLALACEIMTFETQNFNILRITEDSIVNYPFELIDGRIKAISPITSLCDALKKILPSILLDDIQTNKWWNAVFFEENGRFTFDSFFEKYAISDLQRYKDGNLGCFIRDIRNMLEESVTPSLYSKRVYLVGERICNPIRYVLQSLLSASEFFLAPKYNHSAELSQEMIFCPQTELEKCELFVGGSSSLSEIVNKEARVLIPLNSMDLNTNVSKGISWNDILTDKNYDFKAGKIEFKTLLLSAYYDVYNNIYIVSKDLNDKEITKKIN